MRRLKKDIRDDFGNYSDKNRNFDRIRELFDLSPKTEYTVDDITWDDLEMNKIFSLLDRTYTSIGEGILYCILRNPIMNSKELKDREKNIDLFSGDLELTTKIRYILFKLGFDKKNRLLEMLNGLLTINKRKYYLYCFLGKILPSILILSAIIFKETKFLFCFMIIALINGGISQNEELVIGGSGLNYFCDLLKAGKKLSKIKDKKVVYYTNRIKKILESLGSVYESTLLIRIINSYGGVLQLLSIPFLIEESIYYKIGEEIEENKEKIYELIYYIGELDALIGISSYKVANGDKLSIPEFIESKSLWIKGGVHPLLENPVGNDVSINKKGIVLTGTNMSGKSTYLRMIGTNILIAQTLNFTFTKEYKSCFLNVISSMTPRDDISSGKSYYLVEVESILRIIRALEGEITVFSLIDEIFKGTNPIERIASSAEILSYINNKNSMVVVATHDRELTEMLQEEYEFYYFTEEVDSVHGLKFSYIIKRGVSSSRNAIKLLRYLGYPKEIVYGAYKRCNQIEGYI